MGLVLGRRAGEAIHVDGPATIYVDRIRGNVASIHVVADAKTKILRTELMKDGKSDSDRKRWSDKVSDTRCD